MFSFIPGTRTHSVLGAEDGVSCVVSCCRTDFCRHRSHTSSQFSGQGPPCVCAVAIASKIGVDRSPFKRQREVGGIKSKAVTIITDGMGGAFTGGMY